jgi:hypothetical protein
MKMYAIVFLLLISAPAYPQTGGEHWVASWTTPQPLIRNPVVGQRPPAQQPPPAAQPGPAVGAAPVPPPPGPNPVQQMINSQGFHDQTVRMIVHTTIGGSKLRVKLSGPFGSVPVTVVT